jgi:hypothetical protein
VSVVVAIEDRQGTAFTVDEHPQRPQCSTPETMGMMRESKDDDKRPTSPVLKHQRQWG